MMLIEHLRSLAAGLPPGASVTLSGDWLREQLTSVRGQGADVQDDDQTLVQVAERFGRATSTVRAWVEAGRLPGSYKLRGRDWRVPPAAIAAFLEAERKPPAAVQHRRGAKARDLGDWRKVDAA